MKAVLVDLGHTVESGMITCRGLPAPLICDFLSREESRAHYADGTEFSIGRIDMVANTGTYLDSPSHRYREGRHVSQLPLESVAHLEGVVVRAGTARAIGWEAFRGVAVAGKAVLVNTGWDRHWRADAYFEGHPFLTRDAAGFLKDHGAALVGIDSYSIDDTADGRRPVHSILLGADIPICEHLCHLDEVPDRSFRFTAAPVKVSGMGTFPVRAFALVEVPCSGG